MKFIVNRNIKIRLCSHLICLIAWVVQMLSYDWMDLWILLDLSERALARWSWKWLYEVLALHVSHFFFGDSIPINLRVCWAEWSELMFIVLFYYLCIVTISAYAHICIHLCSLFLSLLACVCFIVCFIRQATGHCKAVGPSYVRINFYCWWNIILLIALLIDSFIHSFNASYIT